MRNGADMQSWDIRACYNGMGKKRITWSRHGNARIKEAFPMLQFSIVHVGKKEYVFSLWDENGRGHIPENRVWC